MIPRELDQRLECSTSYLMNNSSSPFFLEHHTCTRGDKVTSSKFFWPAFPGNQVRALVEAVTVHSNKITKTGLRLCLIITTELSLVPRGPVASTYSWTQMKQNEKPDRRVTKSKQNDNKTYPLQVDDQ